MTLEREEIISLSIGITAIFFAFAGILLWVLVSFRPNINDQFPLPKEIKTPPKEYACPKGDCKG